MPANDIPQEQRALNTLSRMISDGVKAAKGRRYCGPCDEWVRGDECPKCGADTDKAAQ